MRAHDKYYGEALREAESGKRRDDLWGRALAMAKGDTQAASGIYIDLLASRLESQAGSPEKLARAAEAAAVVGAVSVAVGTVGVAVGTAGVAVVQRGLPHALRLFWYLFWIVVRVVVSAILATALTLGGFAAYQHQRHAAMEKEWVAAMHARLGDDVTVEKLRRDFDDYTAYPNSRGLGWVYHPIVLHAVEGDLGYDAIAEASNLDTYNGDDRAMVLIKTAATFGAFVVLLTLWTLIVRFKKRRARSKSTALQPIAPGA
jgi:hypothetical protein